MNAFKNISAIQDSLEIYNVVSAFKKPQQYKQSKNTMSAFRKTSAIQGSLEIW